MNINKTVFLDVIAQLLTPPHIFIINIIKFITPAFIIALLR